MSPTTKSSIELLTQKLVSELNARLKETLFNSEYGVMQLVKLTVSSTRHQENLMTQTIQLAITTDLLFECDPNLTVSGGSISTTPASPTE